MVNRVIGNSNSRGVSSGGIGISSITGGIGDWTGGGGGGGLIGSGVGVSGTTSGLGDDRYNYNSHHYNHPSSMSTGSGGGNGGSGGIGGVKGGGNKVVNHNNNIGQDLFDRSFANLSADMCVIDIKSLPDRATLQHHLTLLVGGVVTQKCMPTHTTSLSLSLPLSLSLCVCVCL